MHTYAIRQPFASFTRTAIAWIKFGFPLYGLFFIYCLSIVFPVIVTAATPEEDFAQRCAAPGVISCIGFDNTTTDIVQGVNLWPDGTRDNNNPDGIYRGGLDTSIKASGNGSLRFDVPPPPHAGADIAGRWMPATGRGATNAFGGPTFSLGTTFHLQYRTRMDQNYIDNSTSGAWTRQWKNIILHQDGASCAEVELTTIRKDTNNLVWAIYDACGRGIGTGVSDLNFKIWTGSENLQNSDFDCEYQPDRDYSDQPCFFYTANEWMTFYWKVTLSSDWNVPDGKIEVWVSTESNPAYRKLIEVNQWPSAGTGAQGYNNLTLTTYMTALPKTDGLAGITSRLWYDELIVSTQPINAPNSKVPLPPTNLSIQ